VTSALVNDFTPAPGDTFDLIDCPTTGAFANLVLPDLPTRLARDTSRFPATGVVAVIRTAPIPEPK
jgi:hypothetical protein